MKKNIGAKLALYPMPLVVVGTMNGSKPTWTLVGHVGIIGHDRVMVSLAAAHFINGLIKENKTLSINIVDEKILPEADYSGSVSGIKTDKSELFEYEIGDAGAPVISAAPLTMECGVEDIYQSPNFESFICSIKNTYVDEAHLTEDGKINYGTLKPILFEFPTYEYLQTGEIIGKCLSIKDEIKEN
ncbi:MAG: flavin reductase family protein [Oscillospiraceae bacterium]|nr:flavin reductase family protein [Oscillospiraceae bacterium]